MKTYEGDVFIVPNMLIKIDFDKIKRGVHTTTEGEMEMFNAHPDELYVQVWMTGDNCDNWFDHFYPFRIQYLPLSFFENKKEGDVIEFESRTASWRGWDRKKNKEKSERCKVKLTLNQIKYRYCRFGPFENVLKSLIKSRKEWDEKQAVNIA